MELGLVVGCDDGNRSSLRCKPASSSFGVSIDYWCRQKQLAGRLWPNLESGKEEGYRWGLPALHQETMPKIWVNIRDRQGLALGGCQS